MTDSPIACSKCGTTAGIVETLDYSLQTEDIKQKVLYWFGALKFHLCACCKLQTLGVKLIHFGHGDNEKDILITEGTGQGDDSAPEFEPCEDTADDSVERAVIADMSNVPDIDPFKENDNTELSKRISGAADDSWGNRILDKDAECSIEAMTDVQEENARNADGTPAEATD